MALTPIQKRIFGIIKKLDNLRETYVLTDDLYYKELVILSYDFASEGELDDAIALILKVDRNYFKRAQAEQAAEDSMYKEIVLKLFSQIKEYKGSDFSPIQPTAEA